VADIENSIIYYIFQEKAEEKHVFLLIFLSTSDNDLYVCFELIPTTRGLKMCNGCAGTCEL
jgi:hypothetical protein